MKARAPLAVVTAVSLLITGIIGPTPVYAQDFRLPTPGVMVHLSPAFSPALLKGIKLDPKNPFRFQFFVDSGDSKLSQEELKNQSSKLIKYFLTSLTIPEKDLWVNLSPYEKDRIVPREFGQTEMGRDLLAEDYLLKQITASLIYPEGHLGREFWAQVYARAQAKYGTTDISINTFNKVWIVPEKAVVYENGGVAFVLENHLKVMLEQDYLSLEKHQSNSVILSAAKDLKAPKDSSASNCECRSIRPSPQNNVNALGSQIVREIVIPALTKEVNEGKNFVPLRQVFYSLILATWYKKKIKDSILNKSYSNRNKIGGVSVSLGDKDRIYQEYLKAFKRGVYNYIKEEPDPITNEVIPRKYFSGGVNAAQISNNMAMVEGNRISPDYFGRLNKNMFRIDGFASLKSNPSMDIQAHHSRALLQKQTDGAMSSRIVVKNALERAVIKEGDYIVIRAGREEFHGIYLNHLDKGGLRYFSGGFHEIPIRILSNAVRDGSFAVRKLTGHHSNSKSAVFDLAVSIVPEAVNDIKRYRQEADPDVQMLLRIAREVLRHRKDRNFQELMSEKEAYDILLKYSDPDSFMIDAYLGVLENRDLFKFDPEISQEVGPSWTSAQKISIAEWVIDHPKQSFFHINLKQAEKIIMEEYRKIGMKYSWIARLVLNGRRPALTQFQKIENEAREFVEQEVRNSRDSEPPVSWLAVLHNPKLYPLGSWVTVLENPDLFPVDIVTRSLNGLSLLLPYRHDSVKAAFGILDYVAQGSKAMMATASNPAIKARGFNKGGIDLNPAQMSMQIKKEGQGFKFDFNGTKIDAAQVIGATFTIRTMIPVTNLPQELGLNLELGRKPKQSIQQLAL